MGHVAGAHSRYSLVAEGWSFVSMGEDGVQETDYMHFKDRLWDGRMIRSSSTKTVISQFWIIISTHAIHH